ncbi:CLUMA_CG010854, isoform A [Clunio marinus]|uniref:CLUMA_CG010854, isoform A n=1 Tax=Clunio marinus TaxID=568069 RepID=A0A1J1IG89_9DIPT|nr:CLUMA_CG010854, isoform A [Clunio marinus]
MNETLRLTPSDVTDWFMEDNAGGDHKIPHVILNDKLMTDALLGTIPIKAEHSYSLASDGDSMPDSPSDGTKVEDLDDGCHNSYNQSDSNNNNTTISSQKQKKFLQLLNNSASSTNIFGAGGLRTPYYNGSQPKSFSDSGSSSSSISDLDDITVVKEEPMSPHSSCPPSPSSNYNIPLPSISSINPDLMFDRKPSSMLRDQHSFTSQTCSTSRIKSEPQVSNFGLPPTPPSSTPGDESKGNSSPEHSTTPMSPPVTSTSSSKKSQCNNATHSTRGYTNSTRQPIHTPLISNQPKGSTGELVLTDEEKRTLLAEGYPIPQRLPLTKAEEKSLKKIRRKIKNKISAQESRRKKKEYMDQLERRVEKLVMENNNFRQKVKTLSDENSNLLKELQQLLFTSFPKNQSLVISRNAKRLLRADLEEKIDSTLE